MRIALVNPNTTRATTDVMVWIAAEAAGAGVRVEGLTARFGAPLITDPDALDIAAQAVAALRPDMARFDAVIVSAFGDPGLEALRAQLGIPVTGIAEAGMAEAGIGGRRFAVVTTTPRLVARIDDCALRYHAEGYGGTWTTPGDPAAVMAEPARLDAALTDAIHEAVDAGAAEAVVIGGGPLAMAARALAGISPVPLIEPVPAAVRLTVMRLGLEVEA